MRKDLKQYAANIGIIVKNSPVEANNFMSMVKRYYESFQQVYSIITSEIPEIEPKLVLQIFFKAINNSEGSHGLITTLLVFGTYPKMTKQDAPS